MKKSLALFILAIAALFNSTFAHEGGEGDKIKFIENKGQWDSRALYKADNGNLSLFMEKNALTYNFVDLSNLMQRGHFLSSKELEGKTIKSHAFRVTIEGSNKNASISGTETSEGVYNYFIGNDPSKWASGVKGYNTVNYTEIYNGIDLKFYTSANDLKYDFIVKPGADPNQIAMSYEGADKVYVSGDRLIVETSIGSIIEQKPFVYQFNSDNTKKIVSCKFKAVRNKVTFILPDGYDNTKTLYIDPKLMAVTYTGSKVSNWGYSATYDNNGHIYTSGIAFGSGYPTTFGAQQITFNSTITNPYDISVSKFSANGKNLLYSTYLGGSDAEIPMSTICDSKDRLIIYGRTYSSNFPANGYKTTKAANQSGISNNCDIIITKLNDNGAMIASTYIGGGNDDGMNISDAWNRVASLKYNYADDARGEILVDGDDNIYVGSSTHSNNFPTQGSPMKTTINQSPDDQDGILFKMDSSLTTLIWSTYIGGGNRDGIYSIALDDSNDVYITGGTNSTNFPSASNSISGHIDGFVAQVKNDGSAILGSRYVGTSAFDQSYIVKRGPDKGVYLFGLTEGAYPVTSGKYSNPNSGQFIHKFSEDLSTSLYSTVVGDGTPKPNIAPTSFLVDDCGWIYLSGFGRSIGKLISINQGYNAVPYPDGYSINLPITSNAVQNTTDSCDFYYMILAPGATGLHYGSYFGAPNGEIDHVDGGTSRFDAARGITYQAMCTGCMDQGVLNITAGAYASDSSDASALGHGCNNAVIKFNLDANALAQFSITGQSTGCEPFTVSFGNTSQGATDYIWDFGDGSAIDSTFSPTHVFTLAGSYTVNMIAIDSTGCNDNDTTSLVITVNGIPSGLFMAPPPQCSNGNSFDFAAIGGTSYSWTFSGASPGTSTSPNPTGINFSSAGLHAVTVKISENNCDTTITDTVLVLQSPNPNFTYNAPCGKMDVDFVNGSTFADLFAWDFGDNDSSIALNPSHTYATPGTYNVSLYTINLSSGCIDSVMKTVKVDTVLVATFAKPANQCENKNSFDFNVAGNFSSNATVAWTFGSSATPPSSNTASTTGVTYTGPGAYPVTVKVTDFGCDTTFNDTVRVYAMPVAKLTFTPDSGCIPLGVLFDAKASTSTDPIALYSWDMGDGNKISGSGHNNPWWVYEKSNMPAGQLGVFNGTMTVTSIYGCTDTITFQINEIACPITVPNVFTPEGDGYNDNLVFKNLEYYPGSKLKIWNRWGRLIYENDSYVNDWNPTKEEASDGTYYFILYVNDGREIPGWVTIRR